MLDNHPDREGLPIDLEKSTGLLWENPGPGKIKVFAGGFDLLILVRAWLNDYGLRNQEAAFGSFLSTSYTHDLKI